MTRIYYQRPIANEITDAVFYTDASGQGHVFYIWGTDAADEDGYSHSNVTHVLLDRNGYDLREVDSDSFTIRSDMGSALRQAYDMADAFIECDSVPLEQRWQEDADREAAERRGW